MSDGTPITSAAKLSSSTKRGCPTCDGVDPKSCLRCMGKTRMCDWYHTAYGWGHVSVEIKL